jgi:hypothetical protein
LPLLAAFAGAAFLAAFFSGSAAGAAFLAIGWVLCGSIDVRHRPAYHDSDA